ncbi:VOC family protein [Luteitalea sp.]|uniref:VOC family protein n=1 Tax=Luteitalea sp. TaxID=2004800 RepID=UPI0025BBE43E|nr:VOC family protein [Luteitalea sp.]
MALTTVNAYLTFDGTAADAIALYERALGAKVTFLQRFREIPGAQFEGADADRVMHATLSLGSGTVMVSDTMPGMGTLTTGTAMNVAVQYDSTDEVDVQFAALAEGGRVTMPLENTFWGARFGTLVDRYGVNWMFNAELPK